MGVFKAIKEAKYSEGGNYLQAGVHRLKISAVKLILTRKGANAFVAECEVLESTNSAHIPGSEVTWMVTLDKEPAMGNIKQFIAAVFGYPETEVDEAVAEMVVSEKQPAKNHIVRASATNIKTKKGNDFTKVKFFNDSDANGATEDAARAAA